MDFVAWTVWVSQTNCVLCLEKAVGQFKGLSPVYTGKDYLSCLYVN